MSDSLYEQLHKTAMMQKEIIAKLRKENKKLKKALQDLLSGMSESLWEYDEYQVAMAQLETTYNRVREINLDTDEDE